WKVSVWKILPLLLFAAFALLVVRFCNGIPNAGHNAGPNAGPDAKKAAITEITGSPASATSLVSSTEIARAAAARTMAALSGLTVRSSAEDLVKALNLNIINFNEGSSVIPADQHDVLKKSAEAIIQAPAGTKLEIGCHTDNRGGAVDSLKLSEARAD